MKAYFLLTISIICEVIATTMLKISDGFTLPLPSAAVVLGYGPQYGLESEPY